MKTILIADMHKRGNEFQALHVFWLFELIEQILTESHQKLGAFAMITLLLIWFCLLEAHSLSTDHIYRWSLSILYNLLEGLHKILILYNRNYSFSAIYTIHLEVFCNMGDKLKLLWCKNC